MQQSRAPRNPQLFQGVTERPLEERSDFTLKPTQDLAVHRFVQFEKEKTGIFLLHNVGSGKTITSITIAINSLPRNDALDALPVVDGNAFNQNQNVNRQIVVIHPTGLTKNYHDDMVTQLPRIHFEATVGGTGPGQKVIYSYILRDDVRSNQPQKMYFLVHFLEYRDLSQIWVDTAASMVKRIHEITKGRIVIFDEAHRLFRPLLPGGNETIADKILSNKLMEYDVGANERARIFGSAKRLILMTGTPFSKGVEDFGKLLAITNLSSVTVDPDNERLAVGQAYNFDFRNVSVRKFFYRSNTVTYDANFLNMLFGAIARTVRGIAVGDDRIYGVRIPFVSPSATQHPKFTGYTGKNIKAVTARQINKDYKLAYDFLSWRQIDNIFNRRSADPTFRQLLKSSFQAPASLEAGKKRMARSRRRSPTHQKQLGGRVPVILDEAKSIFGYTTEEITEKDVSDRYKKLALQLHPDRSTGDKSKFQKLQSAREVLLSSKSTEATNPIDGFAANAMYFSLLDMNQTERQMFLKKIEVIANSEPFKNASKTFNQEYLEVEMLSMLPHHYYNIMHTSVDFINKLKTEHILDAISQPIPPEIEKQYYENVAIVNDIATLSLSDSMKPFLLKGGADEDEVPEIKLTKEEEDKLATIRVLAEYVRLVLLAIAGEFIRLGENPEYLVILNEWILMNDDVIEYVNDLDLAAAVASVQKVLTAIRVLEPSAQQTGGAVNAIELGVRIQESLPEIAEAIKEILSYGGGIIKLTPGVGGLVAKADTLISVLITFSKTEFFIKAFASINTFADPLLNGIYSYVSFVPALLFGDWPTTLATVGALTFVTVMFGYRTAKGRQLRTTVSLLGGYVDNAFRGILAKLVGDPAESTVQALYETTVKKGHTYYAYLLRAQLEAQEYFDGNLDISKFAGKSREYLSLIDSVMPNVNVNIYRREKYLALLKEVYNNNQLTTPVAGFNYPKREVECVYVPYTPEQLLFSKHIQNLKLRGGKAVPDLDVAPWYLYINANELRASLIGNVSRSIVMLQKRQIGMSTGRPPAIYNPMGDLTVVSRGQKVANVCLNRYTTNIQNIPAGASLSFECPKFKKILDYLLFMKLGYMISIDGNRIVEQPNLAKDDTDDARFIQKIPLTEATRHWLPFVFSTSDEVGLNLFGAYLNEKGYKYITLHDNDNAATNAENLKAATDMSWSLLKGPYVQHINSRNIMDFVVKNLIGFDKQQQRLGPDGRTEVIDFEGRFLSDAGKAWIKTQPLCILLHPFKTEGINGKNNPAIIMMEPPLTYGDYEQLCGRVLRTYSGMYDSVPVKRIYQVMGYTYPGIQADILDPFDGTEANVNTTTTVERAEVGLFFDTKRVTPEGYTVYDATDYEFFDPANPPPTVALELLALVRKPALNYAGYYSLTDMTNNAVSDLATLPNLEEMISKRNNPAFKAIWGARYSNVVDKIQRTESHKKKLLSDIIKFKQRSPELGAFDSQRQYENETAIGNMKTFVSEYNEDVIGSILGQFMRDITEQFVKPAPDDINQQVVEDSAPYKDLFDVLFGIDDVSFVNTSTITSEIREIKEIQKNAYLFGKYLDILKRGAAGGPEIREHLPDLDEIIARVEKTGDAAVKQRLYNSTWCNPFPPTKLELCRNELVDVARNLQQDYAQILLPAPAAQPGGKRMRTRRNKKKKTRKSIFSY